MELGFQGERFLYIPHPQLNLMEDSPLTNDLYIYALGYFPHAAYHYINRPKGCNEYLLIYCTEGIGWIELYGKKEQLSKGQFIILPKQIPHQYQADQQKPWSIYWIHFKGNKAIFLTKNFDKPTYADTSHQEERISLFDEIYNTLNEELSLAHLHYANLCLGHLLATFCFPEIYQKKIRHKEYSENVMKRVIQYMNENIEGNLKMEDLTNFCGYSTSYFYRKFVKETGYAPMKYYIRLKIEKACQLLIKTDMKINQIAYKLGFQDPQHFSRVFTGMMGISAWEFRKQNFQL